jgi:hypothetical protein
VTGERIIFECPVCRVVITRALTPLPSNQPICFDVGESAVPEGFFATLSSENWAVAGATVVVNLRDLVGTKAHPDFRRRNGCCGQDGLDGPNLVCVNGHEIGTEKSDCWMPHAVALLDNVIRVNK